jgi:hypothetical protein
LLELAMPKPAPAPAAQPVMATKEDEGNVIAFSTPFDRIGTL